MLYLKESIILLIGLLSPCVFLKVLTLEFAAKYESLVFVCSIMRTTENTKYSILVTACLVVPKYHLSSHKFWSSNISSIHRSVQESL